MIQGIQPGPTIITEQATLFWGVVVSMWIGNVYVDLGIPIGASVRGIESDDCSTSSMISNFSAAEYLMNRPHHPRERFF
jgi:hypothetical protein